MTTLTAKEADALAELVALEIERLEREGYEADQYGVDHDSVDQEVAFWRNVSQRLKGGQ